MLMMLMMMMIVMIMMIMMGSRFPKSSLLLVACCLFPFTHHSSISPDLHPGTAQIPSIMLSSRVRGVGEDPAGHTCHKCQVLFSNFNCHQNILAHGSLHLRDWRYNTVLTCHVGRIGGILQPTGTYLYTVGNSGTCTGIMYYIFIMI